MSIELHPSTLYLRGVEAGDAGDYACEAVDARSGAVVFTAVTTLNVSGDFTRRSTLDGFDLCLVRFPV